MLFIHSDTDGLLYRQLKLGLMVEFTYQTSLNIVR